METIIKMRDRTEESKQNEKEIHKGLKRMRKKSTDVEDGQRKSKIHTIGVSG